MGISTLQSYRGAQVFEAIGLNKAADRQILHRHRLAHRRRRPRRAGPRGHHEARARLPARSPTSDTELPVGGNYQYRVRGEYHLINPLTVSKLQHAVRQQSYADLPANTRT